MKPTLTRNILLNYTEIEPGLYSQNFSGKWAQFIASIGNCRFESQTFDYELAMKGDIQVKEIFRKFLLLIGQPINEFEKLYKEAITPKQNEIPHI